MDRLPRCPLSLPPNKRGKREGAATPSSSPNPHALRFPFSPKQINEALESRQKDPSLHLRLTLCTDVSPEEQNIDCVPHRTDRILEELNSLRDEVMVLKMYSVLCGTSVLVCIRDILNFVLKILDHALKFEVARFPNFEVTLVGEASKQPFQTSVGDGIRYTILLKFVAYLRGDLVEGQEATAQDKQLLSSCLLLLENAEKHVLDIHKAQGVVVKDNDGHVVEDAVFCSLIREEVLEYCNLEGLWSIGSSGRHKRSISSICKEEPDNFAHPFSSLMWIEYKKPLERSSDVFPKPSSAHFQERCLAKTTLLLKDLERKFQNNELGVEADYISILPLGFFLVKTFIKLHNAVERNVLYKKIQAVIPGQMKDKNLPVILLDDLGKKALRFDTLDA